VDEEVEAPVDSLEVMFEDDNDLGDGGISHATICCPMQTTQEPPPPVTHHCR
jgi:hypothetical protein